MLRILTSLSVATLFISVTSFAKDMSLTTTDKFTLKASYYQAKISEQSKINHGVLMLHQCNFNRTMYDDIGKQLAEQGIHALSIDFRGFGESVSEKYSVSKVRELPQEQRRAAWSEMSAHWPSDVKLAFDYLQAKIAQGGKVGVIGASCGGSQAITLAEKENISAISFFSSAQRDENIERYKVKLANTATLIIAAEEDGRTYTSAQQIFKEAKHASSKMISYKGSEHGYPLLDSDKQLTQTIVAWFDNELKD